MVFWEAPAAAVVAAATWDAHVEGAGDAVVEFVGVVAGGDGYDTIFREQNQEASNTSGPQPGAAVPGGSALEPASVFARQ